MANGDGAMIEPMAGDALANPSATAADVFQSAWQAECAMNPAAVYQPDALENMFDPDIGPSRSDVQAAAADFDNEADQE